MEAEHSHAHARAQGGAAGGHERALWGALGLTAMVMVAAAVRAQRREPERQRRLPPPVSSEDVLAAVRAAVRGVGIMHATVQVEASPCDQQAEVDGLASIDGEMLAKQRG